MKKKNNNTKFFKVNLYLDKVEAESARAVAEMVLAYASMLGVILKTASAELVAYLHSNGCSYPYREPKGRGEVYEVQSVGPDTFRPGKTQALPYFIYLPPGREMLELMLTHDCPVSWQIKPHWGDLRALPRSARMWVRFDNEAEPHWHRISDVLRQSILPHQLTQAADCIRRRHNRPRRNK